MIKLHSIGQIEHGEYPFENATIDTGMKNGAIGGVLSGKFTAAASSTKAIMNVEVGDDADLAEYPIVKGSHVRVGDLTKIKKFDIYGYPLPSAFNKDDKLVSNADGALEVNSSVTSGNYFVVKEVILAGGVKIGAVVEHATV